MDHSDYYGLPCCPPSMPCTPVIRRCTKCKGHFSSDENIACTGKDEYWHMKCFVCAQCFKPFDKSTCEYYQVEGRKYCLKDFMTLFAPICLICNELIINGSLIRYKNNCWHPECLICDDCKQPLKVNNNNYINSDLKIFKCFQCNKDSLSLIVNSFDVESEVLFYSSYDIML